MDLGVSIDAERTDEFYSLQSDGTFAFWADGRLAPVDRFLSNFHKPLQRRMLFTDPDIPYPDIRVVRQESTGEIFLLGQPRIDAEGLDVIDRLSVLHSVASDASGYTEYYNYDYDSFDPLNIVDGNIGKVVEGDFYFSVEYVSTRSTEYSDESYQGKYLVYCEENTPLKPDGIFTVKGFTYKVVEVYEDSGFKCALVLQHTDDTVPLIYEHVDQTLSSYDVVSGTATKAKTDYTFAGSVDQVHKGMAGNHVFEVFLKFGSALPIKITVGNYIRTPNDGRIIISSISYDKNSTGQMKLMCEG